MIESEKKLEILLTEEVKRMGGWALKLVPTQVAGLPDRMVMLPGARVFFVEVKTTNQVPRPLQLVRHRQLRKLGFRVEVVDTSKQIKELLNEFKGK